MSSMSCAVGLAVRRFRAVDRAFLAAAACHLPRSAAAARPVTPRALLRWHRALVRRKWRHEGRRPRRPRLSREIEQLVLRLARENPRWGHRRICGELAKLGRQASPMRIRRLLGRAQLQPAPRQPGPSWREFLQAQAASIVAADFFTVESAFLRRCYALFFVEHATCRVHLAGCTTNPSGSWVTQQARNLGLFFAEQQIRFLIGGGDATYSRPFDEGFRSERIGIPRTPIRAQRKRGRGALRAHGPRRVPRLAPDP